MASNTKNLGLYKKDPVNDSNDYLDIKTMLNDNWNKIDEKYKGTDDKLNYIEDEVVTHKAETVNVVKNVTGKDYWKTNPRTTLENAVKRDGDTMTGNLSMGSGTRLIFVDSGNGEGAALEMNGEHFRIVEPEDNDKVWFEIKDDDNGYIFGNQVWHQGNLRKYRKTIYGINKDSWVTIAKVNASQLGTRVRFSFSGTSNSVVVSSIVDVISNHQGVANFLVKSMNGNYTTINLRLLADSDTSTYYLQLKHNGSTTTAIVCDATAYGNETIEFYTDNPTITATERHIHYCEANKVKISSNNNTQVNFMIDNNSVYHEGNSYPVVEKGSNTNGEYIRFADGTQICTRKVLHNFNSNFNQSWTFPASFIEINGGGYSFDTTGKVSGSADNSVYWDNLHKTIGGIHRDKVVWFTLSRGTLFDATGYIYLSAIGKWK